MNTTEAQLVLEHELSKYRQLPYATLRARVAAIENLTIAAPSGKEYQVEIQVVWDNKRRGTIRVLGSVDDGGIRALFPLSHTFAMTANGKIF
jgi:hypothetical protein